MRFLVAALAASVTLASAVAPGGAAKGNGGVVIGCRDALTGSDNQAICVDAFAVGYGSSGVVSATCEAGQCKVTCMEGWEAPGHYCKRDNTFNICEEYETATPLGCHCYTTLADGKCQSCPPVPGPYQKACTFTPDPAQPDRTTIISRIFCIGMDLTAQSAGGFRCDDVSDPAPAATSPSFRRRSRRQE